MTENLPMGFAALAAAVVPGASEALRAQAEVEQAMVALLVMVAKEDAEAYVAEVERRWEFAVERAQRSPRSWLRPNKAETIRSMTREIAAGIL